MEIWYTDRGSIWQFASSQYHQPHEEWDKDLENNETKQKIPQYAKLALLIEDLEEEAFVIEIVYQLRLENKVECNTPPITLIHTKMRIITSVYVLQTNESMVKQSWQNILLLG